MTDADHVVLLDDAGRAIGTAPKHSVHDTDTALHLAFSCYVFDSSDRVLMTRRALGKATWPGVWTNSFCGHPRPGESLESAVHRRAQDELGLTLTDVSLALPDFRYRATDASGIVENEMCPVFTARAARDPVCNPLEAVDAQWVSLDDVVASIGATPWAFSPWLVLQAPQLPRADSGRISDPSGSAATPPTA